MIEDIQNDVLSTVIPKIKKFKEKHKAPEYKTILVIDDNLDARQSMAEVLIAEGFTVRTAKNGLEGLKSLQKNELPSLVLLDLNMPVMDGYELISMMRETSSFKKIPVIVVSGDIQFERLKERGFDKIFCLEKPVDFSKLVQIARMASA